jgi:hypothetical protein
MPELFFECGDSGMDLASLDPKALSGQKPERSASHRCRYRLVVSAGLGVLVASQIVVVLGYTG